ncbi:complex I assembly factor TIMMDC1, mitochondrial-like [Actinia tenebrosa]|uniref:Complex I assembly factor TIMMDC1, mitochondrial n=1 Tax=Actinia tenebrosa TaxID=6105 RepID=A0A6P8I0C5_ACTTE|nr:complex I assembly factor TIMMDC1, mitochondrial-like [Actinia tenebrosa]
MAIEGSVQQDVKDQTGWDRVKALFETSEDGTISEELQSIPTIIGIGSVFGFLLGGQFGIRIGADHYVKQNQLTVYHSQMHAQREFQSAKTLGFVKYGSRWGWRMGLFAGLYSFLLTLSTTYRDKNDALNYVAAGASTGALYKLFGGWRSMVVSSLICSGVSLPIGLLAQAGNTFLIPEEYKIKVKEEKEQKRRKWEEQLQVTDSIIENMEKELESEKEQSQV